MNNVFKFLITSFFLIQPMAFAAQPDLRNYAIGGGFVYNPKVSNESNSFYQISPEIVGYAYYAVTPLWTLRPGVRFNYSWNQQTENLSQSFQIEEYDFKTTLEVSAVFRKSWVVYSVTFATGVILRSTQLQVQPPIIPSDNSISGISFLPFIQGQFSTAFVISQDLIEIGPFMRYTHVFDDHRITWAFGAEASVGF